MNKPFGHATTSVERFVHVILRKLGPLSVGVGVGE